MAKDWAYIGGGLLSGVGQGMVAEAKGRAAREAARAQLEAEYARDVRNRKWGQEDAQADFDRRQGEVTRTETDAEGNTYGITRGGEKVDLGIKGVPGGSKAGQDPARVKEANWLVKNGIYPDLATAYEATRERVGMSDEDKRTKALSWVANQKDRYGRAKFTTPEQIGGAVSAYMKVVDGDLQGGMADLSKIDPDAKKDGEADKGTFRSMWDSMFGGAAGEPTATAPEPAAGGDESAAAPAAGGSTMPPQGDGTEANPYRPATQQQFDALPPGAIFINPKDGKPYRKK